MSSRVSRSSRAITRIVRDADSARLFRTEYMFRRHCVSPLRCGVRRSSGGEEGGDEEEVGDGARQRGLPSGTGALSSACGGVNSGWKALVRPAAGQGDGW